MANQGGPAASEGSSPQPQAEAPGEEGRGRPEGSGGVAAPLPPGSACRRWAELSRLSGGPGDREQEAVARRVTLLSSQRTSTVWPWMLSTVPVRAACPTFLASCLTRIPLRSSMVSSSSVPCLEGTGSAHAGSGPCRWWPSERCSSPSSRRPASGSAGWLSGRVLGHDHQGRSLRRYCGLDGATGLRPCREFAVIPFSLATIR